MLRTLINLLQLRTMEVDSKRTLQSAYSLIRAVKKDDMVRGINFHGHHREEPTRFKGICPQVASNFIKGIFKDMEGDQSLMINHQVFSGGGMKQNYFDFRYDKEHKIYLSSDGSSLVNVPEIEIRLGYLVRA